MHFRSSGEDLICTLRYIIWSFMQLNFGLYFYQNMFIDLRTRANQFMSLLFIKRAEAVLAILSKRFRFITLRYKLQWGDSRAQSVGGWIVGPFRNRATSSSSNTPRIVLPSHYNRRKMLSI